MSETEVITLSDTDYDEEEEEEDQEDERGDVDAGFVPCGYSAESEFLQALDIDVKDCQNFSTEGIVNRINEMADSCAQILDLPSGVCKVLLPRFHWSTETLMEKFYESGDTAAFLTAHRVLGRRTTFVEDRRKDDCALCCETRRLISVGCEHKYCQECWTRYCTTMIGEQNLWSFTCPDPSCGMVITEDAILRLVDDEKILATFKQSLINSFVGDSSRVHWCPATDCEYATKVPTTEKCGVPCLCSFTYCSQCKAEWHEVVDCELFKKWEAKKAEDTQSLEWLNKNSKPCPRCKAPIEKNGGCNHMTCRKPNCGYEFCWLCMGDWSPRHACNLYGGEPQNTHEGPEFADLARFKHYLVRFDTHQKAMRDQRAIFDVMLDKKDVLKELLVCTKAEIAFVPAAISALEKSRRTLMFSYVFGFFLAPGNEASIFEANQTRLETSMEVLSGYLEGQLDAMDEKQLARWKRDVQDWAAHIRKQRANLLVHIHEKCNELKTRQ
ncbi:RBR-type E3 ubiquitin transferase [Aphelenchoides fujianensis]|nr:RBR-type E3 ubiquitin transferase [Aphelenchoides fujianensis]